MEGVTAIVLFCEDIREEADRKFSLNGIFGDAIHLPMVPAVLPKLGIFARVNVPLDCAISSSIQFELRLQDGLILPMGIFDEEQLLKEQERAKDRTSPFSGFVMRAIISPAPIPDYGRMQVFMKIAGAEKLIGQLNVLANPDPTSAST